MKFLTCFSLILSALFLIACQQAGKPAREVAAESDKTTPATAASQGATAAELVGVWYVEYIGDRPVIDRSPARIQFAADGAINGNASCNRFFGSYSYINERLTISENLGATKMMCLPALMDQEQRLFQQLPGAVQANLANGLLILRDAQGNQVIKASRDESQ